MLRVMRRTPTNHRPLSEFWSDSKKESVLKGYIDEIFTRRQRPGRGYLCARKTANNAIRIFAAHADVYHRTNRRISDGRRLQYALEISRLSGSPKAALDICDKGQRALKPKGGWGKLARPTRFGKRARHFALEAGSVMDTLFGTNVIFATTTIPGGGADVLRTVAEWSGYIVNRMTQYLRRAHEQPDYIYVWEWQRRGALHLHVAFVPDCKTDIISIRNAWIHAWFTTLRSVSSLSAVDLFQSATGDSHDEHSARVGQQVEPVRKSIGRYLAKYLSKQSLAEQGKPFHSPGRWWGASARIRQRVRAARQSCAVDFRTMDDAIQALQRYARPFIDRATTVIVQHNPIIREDTKLHGFFSDGVFSVFWTWLAAEMQWERIKNGSKWWRNSVVQMPLLMVPG